LSDSALLFWRDNSQPKFTKNRVESEKRKDEKRGIDEGRRILWENLKYI